MKLSIFKKFLIVFGFSLIIAGYMNSGVYATETCQKPCYANKCYIALVFDDFQCTGITLIPACFDENGDLKDIFVDDSNYNYTIQKGPKCYSLIAIRKDNVDGDNAKKIELKLRFSSSCGENSCIQLKCGTLRAYNDDGKLIFCYSLTGYKFDNIDNSDAKTQLVPQSEQGLSSLLKN